MTELYYIDLENRNFEEVYVQNKDRLSNFRIEKIERFKREKDKLLSLGAGILTDEALRPFGLSEKDMQYELGDNGKPVFLNAQDIFVNISHSENMAVLAISSDLVGCDIQHYKDFDIRIAERFFTREEYEYISKKNSEAMRQLAFGKVWTMKESYVKMLGCGLSKELNSFNVLTGEGMEEAYFREYYQFPDYALTVCSRLGDFDLSIRQIIV